MRFSPKLARALAGAAAALPAALAAAPAQAFHQTEVTRTFSFTHGGELVTCTVGAQGIINSDDYGNTTVSFYTRLRDDDPGCRINALNAGVDVRVDGEDRPRNGSSGGDGTESYGSLSVSQRLVTDVVTSHAVWFACDQPDSPQGCRFQFGTHPLHGSK